MDEKYAEAVKEMEHRFGIMVEAGDWTARITFRSTRPTYDAHRLSFTICKDR
ncbi:MAG: hypothetical protein HY540_03330 [Deltaproteobacteria bacterium]|nr:hypothetical protein [Deltaproteobacteria bacterium]